MVNATIIIGLLVLLTFNSISTPFVEEEQSAFFAEWYDVQQDLREMDKVLLECNTYFSDQTDDMLWDSFYNSTELVGIDDTNKEYNTRGGLGQQGIGNQISLDEKIIKERFASYKTNTLSTCHELPSEKSQLTKKLDVLNNWGIEFNYLEFDEQTSQVVESKYHRDLASGPFVTIMTNLAMILPFLISSITEGVLASRKNHETASKISLLFMVAGFVVMVIGMGIIGFSFYQASAPFLNF